MKKTVLLSFVGQYRTFEKTADNIFNNIIIPNKDDYNINIVINTEIENTNTNGNKLLKHHNYDQNTLIEKLANTYNRFNQLQYIYFSSFEKFVVNPPCDLFGIRIAQILEIEQNKNNVYDYYIFCRLDVIINKPIRLDEYFKDDKLLIISGNFYRKCDTYHRDWNFIWLGTHKSLFTFMYPYANYKIKNNDFINIYNSYDELIKRNLTTEEIQYIREKGGLDGDISDYFKGVHLVLTNNCKFEFSEKYGIYSGIIR